MEPSRGILLYRGEKYKRIAMDIGALVDAKNEAYGNSFSECQEFLNFLYPQGVPPDHFKNLLAIVRIWDKIKRIVTHNDAFGENPWRDIAGYAILMCAMEDNEARQENENGCEGHRYPGP